MPLTITPRAIQEPEVAYDKTLISLAISPIIMGNDIEAAMSMRCVPYRVLADGSICKADDLAVTINSGAVFAEAATDPALASAAAAIWDALQAYLTAKGI
jgi:hypothetical protein